MKKPTLSVLMAVHDAGAYLKPAVESILCQDFGDFEFLIVNDASTDGSGEVLEDYARRDARVRLRHNKTNSGLTQCLEALMGDVRGVYVARMDADDISLPGRFQAQVERFRRDQELGVLGTWVRRVLRDGTPLEEVRYPDRHNWIVHRLETANCYEHGSMMFKHDRLQAIGRPIWRFRYGQDYDLYLRLLDITRFGIIEEIYYVTHWHGESICSKISPTVRADCNEMMRQLRAIRKQGLAEYDWRSREAILLSAQNLQDQENLERGRQLHDHVRAILELRRGNVLKARELLTNCMKNPHLRRRSHFYFLISSMPAFLRVLALAGDRWLRLIRYPDERFIRQYRG